MLYRFVCPWGLKYCCPPRFYNTMKNRCGNFEAATKFKLGKIQKQSYHKVVEQNRWKNQPNQLMNDDDPWTQDFCHSDQKTKDRRTTFRQAIHIALLGSSVLQLWRHLVISPCSALWSSRYGGTWFCSTNDGWACLLAATGWCHTDMPCVTKQTLSLVNDSGVILFAAAALLWRPLGWPTILSCQSNGPRRPQPWPKNDRGALRTKWFGLQVASSLGSLMPTAFLH